MGDVKKKLILEFSRRIGIGEPDFSDSVAAIDFDGMIVNFHADDEVDELTLFMRIGDVPADSAARLAVYSYLLRTNNFARQTCGGVLGVDDEERQAVFCHAISTARMDVTQLERIIEAFLNLGEAFTNEFASRAAKTSDMAKSAGNIISGTLRA